MTTVKHPLQKQTWVAIHKLPQHAGVSARDGAGTKQKTTRIWIFEAEIGTVSHRATCYASLWVLIADIRMWLTDLKGNYWRESLSMPLTDNQLIIVLIIYSSPSCPLSILAVSLKRSTETFNGLARSPLCWGRVKTTMLALAILHFYTVQVSTPLINPLREEKKLNTNNYSSNNNIRNPDASVALAHQHD